RQDVGPGLAAVAGLVDAGAARAAVGDARVNDLVVVGVDDDLADLGVGQHRAAVAGDPPALAAVYRLQDAAAEPRLGCLVGHALARVDNVWMALGDGQRADGGGDALPRLPGAAA